MNKRYFIFGAKVMLVTTPLASLSARMFSVPITPGVEKTPRYALRVPLVIC